MKKAFSVLNMMWNYEYFRSESIFWHNYNFIQRRCQSKSISVPQLTTLIHMKYILTKLTGETHLNNLCSVHIDPVPTDYRLGDVSIEIPEPVQSVHDTKRSLPTKSTHLLDIDRYLLAQRHFAMLNYS